MVLGEMTNDTLLDWFHLVCYRLVRRYTIRRVYNRDMSGGGTWRQLWKKGRYILRIIQHNVNLYLGRRIIALRPLFCVLTALQFIHHH